jgi:hypothetical protein
MRRVTYVLALAAVSFAASACTPGGNQPTTPPGGDECQIKSDNEKGPGYPYDLAQYETVVAPLLVAQCGTAGCHAATSTTPGNGGFSVYANTAKGQCGFAQTFNSLSLNINTSIPDQSQVITALNGNDPLHPLQGAAAASSVTTLLAYATAAQAALGGGNGNQNVPPNSVPFDYAVYQNTIQPILDSSGGRGCALSGCHLAPAGAAGLNLTPNAANGSAEQLASFNSLILKASLQVEPASTTFYVRATTAHNGGASTVVSSNEAAAILDWITKAKALNNGGSTPTGCEPTSSFNVAVFRDDIQPVLFGDLGQAAGCALDACHGADRTGGALVIKRTNTAEQNLASFACFVNLQNPVASQILACPLGLTGPNGCKKGNHPGQDVFQGAQDPNFQRVLSYLYAAKTVQTPLDFAFFARNINPIFNDVNSVQNGVTNFTCAEATSCHGIQVVGQAPPNGSNFPILANLSDKASLSFNFSSAINFTNFLTPEGSSLFLYPTNEIADTVNNIFATGLPHPGGEDFAVDSSQALAILKWAKGLRPDGQGFLLDWLVAGDYAANDITTQTVIAENTLTPAIFDADGAAQFNQGVWDGFFSQAQDVDLNLVFNRAAASQRIVYAVAYVINTTGVDIDAQVTIKTDDAVKLYVGNTPVLQANNAANGTTALAHFPAFSSTTGSTRILIKLFQPLNVNNLKFSVQLADQFGNPLTDQTGELVIKLSPDGGI